VGRWCSHHRGLDLCLLRRRTVIVHASLSPARMAPKAMIRSMTTSTQSLLISDELRQSAGSQNHMSTPNMATTLASGALLRPPAKKGFFSARDQVVLPMSELRVARQIHMNKSTSMSPNGKVRHHFGEAFILYQNINVLSMRSAA
jgi:hypothetical protein